MKFVVMSTFIDKHSDVFYQKDSIYETDNKKRAKELQEKGFLGEELKVKKSKTIN